MAGCQGRQRTYRYWTANAANASCPDVPTPGSGGGDAVAEPDRGRRPRRSPRVRDLRRQPLGRALRRRTAVPVGSAAGARLGGVRLAGGGGEGGGRGGGFRLGVGG